MATEQKIENSNENHNGVKMESFTNMTQLDGASVQDSVPSESISGSGDATPGIKGDTDQESLAAQGVYGPPTSCYNYSYPGYNGVVPQSDGYYHADGSYTGIQSDNGSMMYYMPGYNQYPTESVVGVDEQCHQPYFTSSGFLPPAVSYGSDAMPCYAWDSTSVGEFRGGTIANCSPSPNALRPSGGNSLRRNGSFAGKSSPSPLDLRSRHNTSSNYSKKNLPAQSLNSLNKVSYTSPDFQLGGSTKGVQPSGNFSSFMHRRQGVYPNNFTTNYRPINRVWHGGDRYKLREKYNRNGFEASELSRGPRAQRGSSTNLLVEKKGLGLTVRKERYNREDFQTQYEMAKFYVIKSYSEDDVHKSIKYDVWASTPTGNKKLDTAFHEAETRATEKGTNCPIFLFFSVNASGQFVGVAEMIGQVDFNKDMDFWQLDKWNGFFPVKWHIIKDIPNAQLRHIILENNDNKDVTYTRDTQEIGLKQGREMLEIFKKYDAKTSLLDDFEFYENREKLLHAKRSSKPASTQGGVYAGADLPEHLEAERQVKEDSVRADRVADPASSLINLTKNLSLDDHPPNGMLR